MTRGLRGTSGGSGGSGRPGSIGKTLASAAIAMATLLVQPADAHKPVTSKYTFTEDVYPIVSRACGACHAPGGVAPMSLLTYDEARPWAESIRLELASGHMPPWFGNPSVAELKDSHKLSPRDLDVVLTWVTGGTPPGPENPSSAGAVKRGAARIGPGKNGWRRGRPDMTMIMPASFSLPAGKSEDTQEFLLETARDRDRFISAADLLPGNPAIVHDALVFVRSTSEKDRVVAAWLPGSVPVATGAGVGFLWRAGEQLGVRIHYKKTWKLENKAAADRSTVGLYLAKAAARGVRSLDLPSSGAVIDEDSQALAVTVVRADDASTDVDVADIFIEAVRPDGSRVPVIGFGVRGRWNQRYWLASPLTLSKGTRLDVKTAGSNTPSSLRLSLDMVRASS
jgi:mono/diheme cytochrome c family protein